MSDQYTQLLYTVLLLLVQSGIIGAALLAGRKWLEAKAGPENYRAASEIAYQAVQAIEQMARTAGWSGDTKLTTALARAQSLGEAHGLHLSEQQWRTLIEASVKSMQEIGPIFVPAPPTMPTSPH